MTEEKCRHCNTEMVFKKEYDDHDGYDVFEYECPNEDCFEAEILRIHVCQNCESQWREWI